MNQLDAFLARHRKAVTWWLAGVVFIALNVSLRFSVRQPPVWDGAMSVYPAAIELANMNFDFPRLFSMPTYYEGGPNTHATSPWTIMVAILISATGSLADALPILHTISYGVAALTVAATYRLIAHSAPGVLAVVGALAVMLFPPMIAQSADIYLDLPLACLGTWGLVLLLRRSIMPASALMTLAVWVKPLAVIFVGVGALFILSHTGPPGKVRRLIVFAAPALVVAATISFLQSADSPFPPLVHRYVVAVGGTIQWLGAMPDLIVILLVTLLLIPLAAKSGVRHETFAIAILLFISTIAFVLLNPLIGLQALLVPRYYIAIIPATIAGILTVVAAKSRAAALSFASLLIVAFGVNINGLFYPFRTHPTFALAERSLAYRDLLALQIEDVSYLRDLSADMPVYYDYFGYYRLEYPELGYSQGPVASGVSVFHNGELAEATLADLPDRFAFMFEYPVLGGEILLRIWDEARAAGVLLTETKLTKGPYAVYVVEVDQSRTAQSVGTPVAFELR